MKKIPLTTRILLIGAVCLIAGIAATVKFSALSTTSTVDSDDYFPVIHLATNYTVTMDALAANLATNASIGIANLRGATNGLNTLKADENSGVLTNVGLWGNIGIGKASSTATLSIKPATSTNTIWDFDYSQFDTNLGTWNFNLATFGSSVNVGPRQDTVFNWGYNNAPGGGGAKNLNDHAYYLQIENFYEPVLNEAVTEYFLAFYTTNNAIALRPFQINTRTGGSNVIHYYVADTINFSRRNGGLQNMSIADGIVNLHNSTYLRSFVNNASVFRQLNAAPNNFLDLFYLDSSDYFRVGSSLSGLVVPSGTVGIGTNTPAAKLQVTGDGSQDLLWQFGTTSRPSLSTLKTNGLHTLAYGTLYTSNAVALPSAATLGLGGFWLGNSNGTLVTLYTLDGSTTAMKVLAP